MAKISRIHGREIFDSRSQKTIEVEVLLDDGTRARESVPSGASTGRHEAQKITDIGRVVTNLEQVILPALVGQEVIGRQQAIDQRMIEIDGTTNKENLGANTILGASLAICRAAAISAKKPLYQYLAEFADTSGKMALPTPMFNIINGGKHADTNLAFQEFMVVPIKEGSFKEKLEIGSQLFQTLKESLRRMDLSTNVGDEGGFAPRLTSNEAALELLIEATQIAKFQPGTDIVVAIDVAASSIPDLTAVTYPLPPLDYYRQITEKYPIILLEDPFKEEDWSSWQEITSLLGGRIKIIGDDLFTTNVTRLKEGIEKKAATGTIIKPDQIGSVTETLAAIKLAQDNNLTIVVSHRSGETESSFIADLSVAVGAEYIKAGAPNRGERIIKYDQLLRIEEELIK